MKEFKKIFLTKPDARELRNLCKGCQFFKPEELARDICSIIGWYNERNIQEIIEYVRHCPCNQKCLVKASCIVSECPIWMDYLKEAIVERNSKLS